MSHDLIDVATVQARSGETYSGTKLEQVEAFITDASALVRLIAETDFHDPDTNAEVALPAAIVPVMVAMVRRAIDVPVAAAAGLNSENFPAYSWSGGGGLEGSSPAASLYATRRERGIIRQAAEVMPMASIALVSEIDQDDADEDEVLIT